MLHKLLPILILFTGCLDAPFDTQIASPTATDKKAAPTDTQTDSVKNVARPESLVSMFRSDDLGHCWMPIGDGLPEDLQVAHLDTLGKQIVLASANYGVYLSDPEKQSWQQLDTTSLPNLNITSLHVADGVIYAGVFKQGIYASKDSGKTWTSLNHNLKDERVKSILRTGNELWIGTDRGIYALQDGSKAWRQISNKPQMKGLLKVGNNFVAGTYEGIALSSNNGETWDVVNRKIKPSKLSVVDGKIIAMDMGEGLELSADMGKTWKTIQDGVLHDYQVFEIVKMGNNLMRSQSDGIYMSQDWGKSWKDIYHFSFSEPFGVLLSTGEQWNEVYSRPEAAFFELIVVDGVVYGGTVRGC